MFLLFSTENKQKLTFYDLEIVNSESVKPYGEQLDLYLQFYIHKFIFIFFSGERANERL